MAKRPDYAFEGGNYSQTQDLMAGVKESTAAKATWEQVSTYRSPLQEAVANGGYITQQMMNLDAIPLAGQMVAGKTYVQGTPENNWPLVLDYGTHIGRSYSRYLTSSVPGSIPYFEGGAENQAALQAIAGGSTLDDPADSAGAAQGWTTGATSGDGIQWFSSSAAGGGILKRYVLLYSGYIRTGASIADMRFWAGWFVDITLIRGSDANNATSMMAFHANGSVVDCMTSDGVTGTTTVTTVSWAANTLYRLDIAVVDGTPTFFINRQAVATISTTLPAITDRLQHGFMFQVTSANAKRLIIFSNQCIWK